MADYQKKKNKKKIRKILERQEHNQKTKKTMNRWWNETVDKYKVGKKREKRRREI